MERVRPIRETQLFSQPLWMQLLPAIMLGGRPQPLYLPLIQNKQLKVPLDITDPRNRGRGVTKTFESQMCGFSPRIAATPSQTDHSSASNLGFGCTPVVLRSIGARLLPVPSAIEGPVPSAVEGRPDLLGADPASPERSRRERAHRGGRVEGPLAPFPLSSLDCIHAQFSAVSPVDCILAKTPFCNPFGLHTYKNKGGGPPLAQLSACAIFRSKAATSDPDETTESFTNARFSARHSSLVVHHRRQATSHLRGIVRS